MDIELGRIAARCRQDRERFRNAEPFPHVVWDDFLPEPAARAVLEDFRRSASGWKYYHHYNEKKRALTDMSLMGENTRRVIERLHSPEFLGALEEMTGVSGLIPDPELDGGGLHETHSGGFLNMHVDFLSHTTRKHWSRQLNLLLYLNEGWKEEYEGALELWDRRLTRCVVKVPPAFNRCVLFRTTEISFHGVPRGVRCPEGESRKSLALYYFRDEGRPCRLSSTYYAPLPGDPPWRRALIAADRALVRAYSFFKRYCGVADRMASRILKHF